MNRRAQVWRGMAVFALFGLIGSRGRGRGRLRCVCRVIESGLGAELAGKWSRCLALVGGELGSVLQTLVGQLIKVLG